MRDSVLDYTSASDRELESATVLCSRASLVRNLAGFKYAAKATDAALENVRGIMADALRSVPAFRNGTIRNAEDMGEIEAAMLHDRFISFPAASQGARKVAVAWNRGKTLFAVMNDVDHLRLVSLRYDKDVKKAYAEVSKVERQLDAIVDFAFDKDLGYLSPNPSNLGTGLHISATMNLFGLQMMGYEHQVLRALDRLGFVVSACDGDVAASRSFVRHIYTRYTLGETENQAVAFAEDTFWELVWREVTAQSSFVAHDSSRFLNYVSRARSFLAGSILLTQNEACDMLSLMAIGAFHQMIRGRSSRELMLASMKSTLDHVDSYMKDVSTIEMRDSIRAEHVLDYTQKCQAQLPPDDL